MSEQVNSVAGQLVGIPVGQVYTAGKGIKIDNVNKTVRTDETVLWEASSTSGATSCTLSESYSNFEYLDIYFSDSDTKIMFHRIYCGQAATSFTCMSPEVSDNIWFKLSSFRLLSTSIKRIGNGQIRVTPAGAVSYSSATDYIKLFKVVGVNRISGGN